MAPIVYTPTVGWCCQNFHLIYRQARGLFISERDRGMMSSLVYNWPASKIHAIVVTDGSRVLGLGDLGVNGLGISIGKLDIYCAGAGFHPSRVMPVVIDVGTNNESLLNHPLYFGLRRRRLDGDEYYELIDEFMRAVLARYPNVLIQFEDFSTNHAQALLDGGAAAEPADAYGDTPLHWAAARGHAAVARMLVTRGGARLRSNQPLILTLTPTLTLTLTLTPTLTLALTLALTLTLTPR